MNRIPFGFIATFNRLPVAVDETMVNFLNSLYLSLPHCVCISFSYVQIVMRKENMYINDTQLIKRQSAGVSHLSYTRGPPVQQHAYKV